MSLREKTDEEISALLTEYGIRHGPIVGVKHGPIVDSTRHLYEKKLEMAMEGGAEEASSDKTYYREEEEEVTYITYHHSPARQEAARDMLLKRRGNVDTEEEEEEEEEESEQETKEPPVQVSHRAANHSAVRSKEPVKKTRSCMGKLIRLLLLVAVLAGAYYAYTQMVDEQGEEKPAGIQ